MFNKEEQLIVDQLEKENRTLKSTNETLTKRLKQYQIENSVLERQVERWKTDFLDVMAELNRRKKEILDD